MATPRGFPKRFPVRDDGARPWRYRIVSLLSRILLRLWFGSGLRITGVEHVPDSGPLVMASNHLSNIDPFLFGGFAPGTWFCLAKRELYANPVVAWILAGCNCFPIERGGADRWALRTSLRILQSRGRLVVFVEGTRAPAPGMKRAEAGVAFLVRRSGARVVPVAITGTEAALGRGRMLPRRVPVTITYGPAFTPNAAASSRAGDQEVADEIGRNIAALLPEAYRGAYAAATVSPAERPREGGGRRAGRASRARGPSAGRAARSPGM